MTVGVPLADREPDSDGGDFQYSRLMLIVTEDQVRKLLPMRECIWLMREVFKDLRTGKALNQARRRLTLPTGSTLHSLAGAWGKYFGTKIYSEQIFSSCCSMRKRRVLWLSSRRTAWGRFAPAQPRDMRPMFLPRGTPRRLRLSAAV